MIIKSLSRKNGSYRCFQQLYDYITRDDGCDQRFSFTQNFILDDRDSILNEFTRNAQYVPIRKNGNYLYHEILSFTRSSRLTQSQQLEIMRKVVQRYAQDRARGCLVFGGVHTDKNNQLHYHLMISANQIDQSKKHSLSKSAYKQINQNTEAHVLEHYPELEQEKLITQTHEEKKVKWGSAEEKKQRFKETIREIMQQASSSQEFQELLKLHGIGYKQKPANITLTNPETGRPHRLKTIQLQDEYEQMIQRGQNLKSQVKEKTVVEQTQDDSLADFETNTQQSASQEKDEDVKR